MSAGMADVIAAHKEHAVKMDHDCYLSVCTGCHWRKRHSGDSGHAAHVAEELAKAGYGKLGPLAAALADPEGHALVKAIHDRKAGA